jgi:hypothetical protein
VRDWETVRLRLVDRSRGLPRTFRELNYSLQLMSILRGLGWHRSVRARVAKDSAGDPLPWYSYPAIQWLQARIRGSDSVFEFGAGQSTLWFAAHVREIVSVEHDVEWHRRLRVQIGPNVTLLLRHPADAPEHGIVRGEGREGSEYAAAIDVYPQQTFDLIAVDGVERVECVRHSISRLRPDGLLILDNSDRPGLRAGIDLLGQEGFGRVDFHGLVPAFGTYSCTSVFWRNHSRWSGADAQIPFHGF